MKTTFTRDDVLKIAELSGLRLRENEIEKFKLLIQDALSFVRILKEVETAGVTPTYQVTGLTNIVSPDDPKGKVTLDIEDTFKNVKSPEKGNYFSVKRMI